MFKIGKNISSQGAYNVRSYGAKGDGVTNDTAAIQKTLDNHKVVYFPEGNYLIDDPLIITEGHTIFGDSAFNTKIIQDVNWTKFLIIEGDGSSIKDIHLEFKNQQTYNMIDGVGIFLHGNRNSIKDVIITKSNRGISIDSSLPNTGNMNYMENVLTIDSYYNGFDFNGSQNSRLYGNVLINCSSIFKESESQYTGGLHIENADSFTVKNYNVENSNRHALEIYNSKATVIDLTTKGCKFGGNLDRIVLIRDSDVWISNVQMINPISRYNSALHTHLIEIGDNSNVTIENYSDSNVVNPFNVEIFSIYSTQLSIVTLNRVKSTLSDKLTGKSLINRFTADDDSPKEGYWNVSDIIYSNHAVPGGSIGWVCTRAGMANKREWEENEFYYQNTHFWNGDSIYKIITSGVSSYDNINFPLFVGERYTDRPAAGTAWKSSTTYAFGDIVFPTTENGNYYRCVKSGINGTVEPNWSTLIENWEQIGDGDVNWERRPITVFENVGTKALFHPFGSISVEQGTMVKGDYREYGTTPERPLDASIGQPYFDTTLGKPVWNNGSTWVDVNGDTV